MKCLDRRITICTVTIRVVIPHASTIAATQRPQRKRPLIIHDVLAFNPPTYTKRVALPYLPPTRKQRKRGEAVRGKGESEAICKHACLVASPFPIDFPTRAIQIETEREKVMMSSTRTHRSHTHRSCMCTSLIQDRPMSSSAQLSSIFPHTSFLPRSQVLCE